MWWVAIATLAATSGQLSDRCWAPAKEAIEGVGTMATGMQPDDTYVGCARIPDVWGGMAYGRDKAWQTAEKAGCQGAKPVESAYGHTTDCAIVCIRFACFADDVDTAPEVSPDSGAEALATQLFAPKTRDKPAPRVRQPRGNEPGGTGRADLAFNGTSGLSLPLMEWPEDVPSTTSPEPPVEELPGMTIVVPREAEPTMASPSVVVQPPPVVPIPASSPELAAFQREVRAAIGELRRSRDDLRERSRKLRDDLRRKREGLRHRSREIRAAVP